MTGRAAGRIVFEPCGRVLRGSEDGVLRFGAFEGDASRILVYAPDGPRLGVCFEDGRPFFDADLSSGRAVVAHDCPPDAYEGRMRLAGPDAWRLSWCVRGPRKRLIIATSCTRAA